MVKGFFKSAPDDLPLSSVLQQEPMKTRKEARGTIKNRMKRGLRWWVREMSSLLKGGNRVVPQKRVPWQIPFKDIIAQKRDILGILKAFLVLNMEKTSCDDFRDLRRVF